jgi:hypothetical protein
LQLALDGALRRRRLLVGASFMAALIARAITNDNGYVRRYAQASIGCADQSNRCGLLIGRCQDNPYKHEKGITNQSVI